MTAAFSFGGQEFVALNGGPAFTFTEAVSFVVNCKTQKEVGACWMKLSRGGEKGRCGRLRDRHGLSWQVVPAELCALLGGPDPDRSLRVMNALLWMRRIDIKALKRVRG